ncbi:MAG: hydroxymethylbilane synthase [Sphingomicrobium sp.]
MSEFLTLGTRASPLALAQAHSVAAALELAHGWSRGTVAIKAVKTSGDKIQDRPLADVGGKALWTKELDMALAAGETDLSVHSMKDVESERPDLFVLAAMMERADVRDRLIGGGSIADLPQGARIGTSSPRRAAQLLSLRPDLNILPIRGNVETRLNKISAGDADATLLAAAGLDRLGIEAGSAIPIDVMLPAPGQAAIGIECRENDARVRTLIAPINHLPTCAAVAVERAFTRRLGGSCHSPVAAHAVAEGNAFRLHAQLLSEDGRESIIDSALIAGEADAIALAEAMLGRSPATIRALFEGL